VAVSFDGHHPPAATIWWFILAALIVTGLVVGPASHTNLSAQGTVIVERFVRGSAVCAAGLRQRGLIGLLVLSIPARAGTVKRKPGTDMAIPCPIPSPCSTFYG
jgi:hypothetical protein